MIETKIDRRTKWDINKSCLYVYLTLNDNKGHDFHKNHNLSNSVHVLMVPEVAIFISNSIESVSVISKIDSSKDIQTKFKYCVIQLSIDSNENKNFVYLYLFNGKI
jgi:hypothetical protein